MLPSATPAVTAEGVTALNHVDGGTIVYYADAAKDTIREDSVKRSVVASLMPHAASVCYDAE